MAVDFTISPLNTALNNPASLAGSRRQDNGIGISAPVKPGGSIGETISSAAGSFVETLEKAEATSIAGIKGDASAYEVASSVMEAEKALRMTIAVRDKIVAAYLEISRMQI